MFGETAELKVRMRHVQDDVGDLYSRLELVEKFVRQRCDKVLALELAKDMNSGGKPDDTLELAAKVLKFLEEKAERLCPSCRVDRCEACAATHECRQEDIDKLEKVEQ